MTIASQLTLEKSLSYLQILFRSLKTAIRYFQPSLPQIKQPPMSSYITLYSPWILTLSHCCSISCTAWSQAVKFHTHLFSWQNRLFAPSPLLGALIDWLQATLPHFDLAFCKVQDIFLASSHVTGLTAWSPWQRFLPLVHMHSFTWTRINGYQLVHTHSGTYGRPTETWAPFSSLLQHPTVQHIF